MPRRKKEDPPALKKVEALCKAHSDKLILLATLTLKVRSEMRRVLAENAEELRKMADDVAKSERSIAALVDANRAAFKSPKTRMLHGVKVGLRTNQGSISFDCDEEVMISRLRGMFDEDRIADFVDVKETVKKTALRDLSDDEQKTLGVTLANNFDKVVVALDKGDPAKIAEALLAFQGVEK